MFDLTEVSFPIEYHFPIEYRKVHYAHRKFKELKKLYKTVPLGELAQTP